MSSIDKQILDAIAEITAELKRISVMGQSKISDKQLFDRIRLHKRRLALMNLPFGAKEEV